MSDLMEFLTARLDDAVPRAEKLRGLAGLLRRQGEEVADLHGDADPPEDDMKAADRLWWTARDAADELERTAAALLAEVESKRRIIALHCVRSGTGGDWDTDPAALCNECSTPWPCETLDLLALPYRAGA